ncbi:MULTISPECIES: GGDEF domain-containing protein [unclassified Rhodococcus (in: high G+C Gram-positive bacteria)]|uniref:GGDEF domain-containing protein n=1 Tax=unclassified Rhodococcus (in: high G+C Gram-positive bacteria) TaxID=192944 RepID=UPI00165DE405|nr:MULTISPECIES: GGDEF domain-containing protein [unclassified Rhodococcus (in: high G+C Gram-positive bacteria)]MDI9928506.1 GGDEF domain-containing protein [Rhodococcus sp. IEGM 1341]
MNSTPHGRSHGSSAGAVRAWFTQPYDYRWMADFQNSRPAGKLVRWVMACLTLNFGVLAVVSLFSEDTSLSPIAVAWKAGLVVMVVAVSAAWITRPFPGRLGVVAFAVFADLGTASTLLINPLADALLTCTLFAVIGTFCTFCLSPRWMVAHLVFAVACTLVAAAATYSSEEVGIASLIFRTNVVLLTIAAVPLVSHLLITTLTDDARRSLLDPLTGLLNRRGLDAAIDDVWPLGREADQCSAAVMIDIDRFKSVNDLYGHEEGDAVIVRIAERLRAHLGEYGVIARTGGEEYLAVVSTSRLHIDALVHGVRRALHDPEDPVAVTVSVGAAILHADSPVWDQNVDIVTRATRVADSMMYEAKAAGGNRIATTML